MTAAIAVAFAMTMGRAQSLDQKVDLSLPATSVKNALAELSKRAGFAFEPTGSVADQIVAIKVKGVVLSELLDRIAKTNHAEWTKSADRWRLTRDSSTLNALRRAEVDARTPGYARAIAQLVESANNRPKFTKADAEKLKAQMAKMREDAVNGRPRRFEAGNNVQAPSDRGLAIVMSAIDPKILASIPVGGRVVFSTSPNVMQRALPTKVLSALRPYVDEVTLYQQALDAGSVSPDGQSRTMIRFGNFADVTGDASLGIAKVDLVVSRANSTDNLMARLYIADPNGGSLGGGMSPLAPMSHLAPANGGEIKLSANSKEMTRLNPTPGASGNVVRVVSAPGGRAVTSSVAFSSALGGDASSTSAEPSAELRAKMLQPEQFDPLSFIATDTIFGAADAKSENVVAWIPDSAFGPFQTHLKVAKFTVGEFVNSAGTFDVTVREEGGWMTVEPARPITAIQSHVNRKALGKVLRVMDQTKNLPLLDELTYANDQVKAPAIQDLDGFYLATIDASASSGLVGFTAPAYTGLRFLASLGADQRQALLAGQKLPVSLLNSNQLSLLNYDAFNSMDGPLRGSTPGIAFAAGMMMMGGQSVADERTEFLVSGIPAQATISIQSSTIDAVLAYEGQGRANKMLDANQLGFERSGMFGQTPVNYTSFRPVKVSNYTLTLDLGDVAKMIRVFHDRSYDANAAPVDYNSLPEQFRSDVDAMAERLKKGVAANPGGVIRRGGAKP